MKEIKNKFGIYPLLIILLSIIGIYYIFIMKKNEYYSNIFERFSNKENIQENFLSEDEKTKLANLQVSLTNKQFTQTLANGTWTNYLTDIKTGADGKPQVVNLTTIDLKPNDSDNYSGTVTLDFGGTIPSLIYNVSNINNLSLYGTLSTNNAYYIEMTFKNPFDINIDPTAALNTVPQCTVRLMNNNTEEMKYTSYKIFDPNIIGGELSRIISGKHYFDYDVAARYDFKTYNVLIGDYKYPSKPITATFSTASNLKFNNTDLSNVIKNDYKDVLIFAYQRVFTGPVNDVIQTKLSNPIAVSAINGTTYFSKMTIKPIKDENTLNGISGNTFFPKSTKVYVYRLKVRPPSSTYTFKTTSTFQKSIFNLKKGAESIFGSSNNVIVPNNTSLKLTINSEYDLVFVGNYDTPNYDTSIDIPWSSLVVNATTKSYLI